MSKTEIIALMAKTILNDNSKVISTDEFNELIAKAETTEEKELYLTLYNYFLQKKQKEVVARGEY